MRRAPTHHHVPVCPRTVVPHSVACRCPSLQRSCLRDRITTTTTITITIATTGKVKGKSKTTNKSHSSSSSSSSSSSQNKTACDSVKRKPRRVRA